MTALFDVIHNLFSLAFHVIPHSMWIIAIPFLSGIILVKAVKSL